MLCMLPFVGMLSVARSDYTVDWPLCQARNTEQTARKRAWFDVLLSIISGGYHEDAHLSNRIGHRRWETGHSFHFGGRGSFSRLVVREDLKAVFSFILLHFPASEIDLPGIRRYNCL